MSKIFTVLFFLTFSLISYAGPSDGGGDDFLTHEEEEAPSFGHAQYRLGETPSKEICKQSFENKRECNIEDHSRPIY